MHATFVFCEGSHDIAFLGRLLTCVGGFSEYTKKLGEFPSPLDRFLTQWLEQHPVENLPVRGLQRNDPPVLELVLQHGVDSERIYLFMNCNGQDRHEPVKLYLTRFAKVFSSPFGTKVHAAAELAGWSMAFFYDADSIGIDGTLELFRERYSGVLGGLSRLRDRAWIRARLTIKEHKTADCDMGCFIFSAPGTAQGTLEDGLLSMLQNEDGRLFSASTAFIDGHALDGCKVKKGPESKRKKAIITAAAQFDHPSYSMAVFLRDTKMLTFDTLRNNEMCKAIIEFFESGITDDQPAIARGHDRP